MSDGVFNVCFFINFFDILFCIYKKSLKFKFLKNINLLECHISNINHSQHSAVYLT
jgi:hypothetical protein